MSEVHELKVGERIRALRDRQGLSLRALAERSGLSINAISMIERGENSPTVGSLQLLANGLGVSITDFFTERQEQEVIFTTPTARGRSSADGLVLENLGSGLRNQQLEPFLTTIMPGSGNIDSPITHPGEEFVYCVTGSVEYAVNGNSYPLETGCSLLFDAGLPHGFRNAGSTPATLIIVFHIGDITHLARQFHLEGQPWES